VPKEEDLKVMELIECVSAQYCSLFTGHCSLFTVPLQLTNHGLFFSCLTEEDLKVMDYLQELDVRENEDIKSGHTISMVGMHTLQ